MMAAHRPIAEARRRQHGAALLIMLALIGVAGSLVLIWLAEGHAVENDPHQRTGLAMGKIRDALVSRAAADLNRPGSLPCPDYDGDGIADGSTCTFPYIGWLPWRTLDLPDLRDASGNRFWYALSQEYRDWAPLGPLNSETNGSLTVTGTQPATGVVAIVFAPGPPLASQDRDPLSTDAMAQRPQYLEGENNDGDTLYVTGVPTGTFNDELLLITRDMLWPTVELRVARQARRCLENFALSSGGFYPWAAPLTDLVNFDDVPGNYSGRIPKLIGDTNGALGTAGWPNDDPQDPGTAGTEVCFQSTFWNSWKELLFYRVAPAYAPGGAGVCTPGTCLTVNGQANVKFVVIVAGRALSPLPNQAGRSTNKTVASNYLETAPAPPVATNNALGLSTGNLARRPRAVTTGPLGDFNDRVECISESGVPPCQ